VEIHQECTKTVLDASTRGEGGRVGEKEGRQKGGE